jgi:aspartate ammonia-lyase
MCDLFRYEKDLLGQGQVPSNALYGIHTVRAVENFSLTGRKTHPSLAHAFGYVKLAAAKMNRALDFWNDDRAKGDAIEQACQELAAGKLDDHIVVDPLQGGAGTSMNMNANEVIANRALQLLGEPLGNYKRISPLDDVNLHQSTNDSYPTSLKLALIMQLRLLDEALERLVGSFRDKAEEFKDVIKIGRTQLQDAVPVTLGCEMASYADAFERGRNHIRNVQDRLTIINLGGTAIGTGIAAHRDYILGVADMLSEVTGIHFTRAENMVDNTQNTDAFVDVSSQLKVCAAIFVKCCTDLRIMSSGPESGFGEIKLPARQAGSSIMPGKVNPVIPEAATQAALRVIGADTEIVIASSMGNFELNPFEPVMADSLLNNIEVLANAADMLRTKCIEGIEANIETCRGNVESSTALVTSLVAPLGYEKASDIAKRARAENKTIREIVLSENLMSEASFDDLIKPRTQFH